MKTKSKDDLTRQIQRIYKNFPNHRLYNLAQHLVLAYNHRMSMSETNLSLHSKYMGCHYPSGAIIVGREEEAQRYLDEMGSHQYPKEFYTKSLNVC